MRRIAALAVAVAAAIALYAVAGSSPRASISPAKATRPAGVTPTVLVVGDSVARMYSHYFVAEAAKRGYSLVQAAWPGCPATGVAKVLSSGKPFKRTCSPQVADGQDAKVAEYRPALVIWWSRYELAPRVGADGKVLRVGSKAWFRAQEASFDERAAALTRLGARLVTVQIEPPGPDLAIRNPGEHYFLVGRTLAHRPAVVNGWDAFLASHDGPDVYSVSIRHLVCHDARFPCDDRLPDGKSARPDGVHYSKAAMRIFAPVIFGRIWRAAGLQPARTP